MQEMKQNMQHQKDIDSTEKYSSVILKIIFGIFVILWILSVIYLFRKESIKMPENQSVKSVESSINNKAPEYENNI